MGVLPSVWPVGTAPILARGTATVGRGGRPRPPIPAHRRSPCPPGPGCPALGFSLRSLGLAFQETDLLEAANSRKDVKTWRLS